jgi:hypothetical protein
MPSLLGAGSCNEYLMWPLWVTWPSLFPEYVALVPASSAFAAIESLMCVCGLCLVVHATASTGDGLLVYRAFGIQLA